MKKNIILLILLLFISLNVAAQGRKNKEKIKALKIAFLTQELNLTAEVAQQFWPVYNTHEENLDLLRNKGRAAIRKQLKNDGGFEGLSEEDAKIFVKNKLDLDNQILLEKMSFTKKIAKVLTYKQILKLQLSERDFARELMRKYRKKP